MATTPLLVAIYVVYHTINLGAQNQTLDLAQVLAGKGLSRITANKMRDNVVADVESIDDSYNASGVLKSHKTSSYTIVGKPKLNSMNMDELYQALGTRFDFYMDTTTVATINNVTCVPVRFRPKQNLKINKTADQVINRISGTIYINLENMQITRVDGSIQNHFSFTYWALIIPIGVDVYNFSFSVDYVSFNNIAVEKNVSGKIDYEVRNRGAEEYSYKLANFRMKQ